jgi:hypothetical protein
MFMPPFPLKQTAGTGDFVTLNQTVRNWHGIAAAPNGDIYACVYYGGDGDIYKQTGGIGNFIALSQTVRNWTGMAVAPNGDIYACVLNGDIYKKQTDIPNSITLNASYAQLRQYSTFQLTAVTVPALEVVTWISSDTRLAKVDDDGLVTTDMYNGTLTITASILSGTITATCIINIVGGNMQNQGLCNVILKNTVTLEEKIIGVFPADGAFDSTYGEKLQLFMTSLSGNIPTEARIIIEAGTLTIDLIFDKTTAEFISTGLYAESATKTVFGGGHGLTAKTFNVRMHPINANIATKTGDLEFYKAVVELAVNNSGKIDGKDIMKLIIHAMQTEVTLATPATPTVTAGSGGVDVKYCKIVATNGQGVSLPSVQVTTGHLDDDIVFVMPYGATGITLYMDTAATPVTALKYWQATDAQIAALTIENVGTLYAGATMTAATALPTVATGFTYAAGCKGA